MFQPAELVPDGSEKHIKQDAAVKSNTGIPVETGKSHHLWYYEVSGLRI